MSASVPWHRQVARRRGSGGAIDATTRPGPKDHADLDHETSPLRGSGTSTSVARLGL
jgi:hypothetical protein